MKGISPTDHMPDRHPPRDSTAADAGIDAKTLFLTAAASAAAAYACSKLWTPGTLAAAGFTPVLVALIKEALAKSTAAVTRAVPVRGVVRSAPGSIPPDYDAGPQNGAPEDPAARVAQPGEIQYHGRSRRSKHWRLAIVTGLLGFLIAAVVLTVPELLAGSSAAGEGRETTIFGGGERDRDESTDPTTTAPAKTVTAPPQETGPTPAPEAAPTPQAAPDAAEPAPAPAPEVQPQAPALPETPEQAAPPEAQPPG